MSYVDGIFLRREMSRKKIRNKYRNQILSESGLPVLTNPFDFDPDPSSQLDVIMGLIEKAASMSDEKNTALTSTQEAFKLSALGIPLHPVTNLLRPNFEFESEEWLAKNHFDLSNLGCFDHE